MDKQLDNAFHIDLSDSEFSLSTDDLVITGSAGEDIITIFDSNITHWQSNSTMNGTINVTNPVYTISTVNANTNYTLDSYNSIK